MRYLLACMLNSCHFLSLVIISQDLIEINRFVQQQRWDAEQAVAQNNDSIPRAHFTSAQYRLTFIFYTALIYSNLESKWS